MYNVELYNKSDRKVIKNCQVTNEVEASKIVMDYIELVKSRYAVIFESNYLISPFGRVLGQTLTTDKGIFDITTAKI